MPNYNCPLCNEPSTLVIGPEQAFCTNTNCKAMTFNPSLPDQGMSNINVIELPEQ